MEVVVMEGGVVVRLSDSPPDQMSVPVTGTAPLETVAPITLPAAPAVSSVVLQRMNRQVAMKVKLLE